MARDDFTANVAAAAAYERMNYDPPEIDDPRDDLDPRECDSCGGPCRDLRDHYPWIRRP